METMVLLKVAEIWAIPVKIFFAALSLNDLGLLHVVRIERQAGGNLFGGFDRGGSGAAFLFAGRFFLTGRLLFAPLVSFPRPASRQVSRPRQRRELGIFRQP